MLNIQDPTYANSFLLHEALLEACHVSNYGAGTYAFVTAEGVNLLLQDETFSDFINRGRFHLIVGMDEITNIRAMDSLRQVSQIHRENFQVNAFMHNTRGALYHPKFCWFKKEQGGILIIGSGNLTQMGLRRNREAFAYIDLNEDEVQDVETKWNDWLTSCEDYIKSIDDPTVIEQARENGRRRQRTRRAIGAFDQEEENEEIVEVDLENELEAWIFEPISEVLIAEVPRSGNRWKQVNFDKESFRDFFGAQPGINGQYRVLLRNVRENGTLNDVEIRQSVSVVSHNYRFELDAASGLNYPEVGRPIGIFIKISPRTFLYSLLMPESNNYVDVYRLVDENRQRQDRLVRYKTNAIELRDRCGNLPILNYLIVDGR